jgi:putative ABC transport system permease protein
MKLPTRWIKVLKDVWGNKTRSALVVLSIAVGVFAVGMTTHARIIIERDLNTAYRAVNPASATLIVSPPFGEDFAHAVEAMREVETAEARRLETVEVFDGEAWREVTLTAAPDFDAVRVNRFSVEQGAGAPGLREILLERETAAMLGAAVGDTLAVRLNEDGQVHDLTVTGVVHDLTAEATTRWPSSWPSRTRTRTASARSRGWRGSGLRSQQATTYRASGCRKEIPARTGPAR